MKRSPWLAVSNSTWAMQPIRQSRIANNLISDGAGAPAKYLMKRICFSDIE